MATTHIILVNWNGRDDTIECLESLLRLDSDDFSVIVIDNGSGDGSMDAFRAWAAAPEPVRPDGPPWPHLPDHRRLQPDVAVVAMPRGKGVAHAPTARITIIETDVNLGFAAACNLGMRIAASDPQARYFWLLNNDTVVAPDSLSHLAARLEAQPDLGILGAALLYYDRPDVVQGLGGHMNVRRGYADHIGFGLSADAIPPEAEIEARTSYVMGASMFLPRAVFDATGGISEGYFLYYEEPDWARRLPPGLRQGICTAARVFHKEGGSIGSSNVHRPSDTSIYYLTASALRFYARYERLHLFTLVARLTKVAIDYARSGDRQAARVMAHALADVLRGRYRRGPYGGMLFHERNGL